MSNRPLLPFRLPKPDLGPWRAGNTGTEGVWHFDSGQPGREVLVTALVHGNELCGAWAVLAALQAGLRPRQGALSLAFCNLAAFDSFEPAAWDRSRAVDQDLNRVWGPMTWRQTAVPGNTTVEQARALQLLPFAERADWLLDLHSMSNPGPALVLSGLPPRHIALAQQLGTPALVVADAGHEEGCRLRDHGRWGAMADPPGEDTRSLLIECGFHGDLAARDVAIDMLGRFLCAAGTLAPGDVPATWWQALPAAQQVLEVTHTITAATSAQAAYGDSAARPPYFHQAWQTGQCLPKAGTALGHTGAQAFCTPYDDCTLIMPSVHRACAGQTIVRLARRCV
jgi:predicted deacylase